MIDQKAQCPKCDWSRSMTPKITEEMNPEAAAVRVNDAKSWVEAQLFRHMRGEHQ